EGGGGGEGGGGCEEGGGGGQQVKGVGVAHVRQLVEPGQQGGGQRVGTGLALGGLGDAVAEGGQQDLVDLVAGLQQRRRLAAEFGGGGRLAQPGQAPGQHQVGVAAGGRRA